MDHHYKHMIAVWCISEVALDLAGLRRCNLWRVLGVSPFKRSKILEVGGERQLEVFETLATWRKVIIHV